MLESGGVLWDAAQLKNLWGDVQMDIATEVETLIVNPTDVPTLLGLLEENCNPRRKMDQEILERVRAIETALAEEGAAAQVQAMEKELSKRLPTAGSRGWVCAPSR